MLREACTRSKLAAMNGKALTTRQLADLWQCSERQVRNMIKAGRLPALRVGDAYRIEAHVVADFEKGDGPQGVDRIYLIQCEATKLVKIGISSNAEMRLRNLRMACPTRLTLLADRPGRKVDEQALHERYSSARRHGEWFALSEDEISSLKKEWGAK